MSAWHAMGSNRPRWKRERRNQQTEVLAALVRALRRKGTELATERDLLIHGIQPLEEGAERLLKILTATQGQNAALVKQVERGRHVRSKLLQKIRELQQQLAAAKRKPAAQPGSDS